MTPGVNTFDLRAARKADTEARVIAAATSLFVDQGYAATTLAQVASAAGVGDRTVYVRFGSKAALLTRAIGVALVGDTAAVSVAARPWAQQSRSLPTAAARIAAAARGARELFERAGPLLVVAAQAEASEPIISASAQEGRVATHDNHRAFWHAMRRDGLLLEDVDLPWLVDTTTLLGSADTYVQITRLHGWDLDTYEAWMRTTWTLLSTPPAARDGKQA